MPQVALTPALQAAYTELFATCTLRPERQTEIEGLIDKLLPNQARYESVADRLNIPWYFIAVIHNMESSQRFDRHLHNGDPLTARTIHVPRGRPATGSPPFPWEASAEDALRLKQLHQWTDWSIPGLLYKLEEYNGWGYRLYHPEVLSPYLWSYSNHYTSGKYVADGTWSATATSTQCGAAVLLRRMAERQLITLDAPDADDPLFRYSATTAVLPYAADLQRFLNTLPGIQVAVDGQPGKRTSEAVKKAFGSYLDGDPRS